MISTTPPRSTPTRCGRSRSPEALRGLIHQANLARDARPRPRSPDEVRDTLISRFRHGVLVGLSDTTSHGTRPGERKARLLLEVLRDRQADVLRFAHDLTVPPTSNQAERDLRPSKIQQNISGRLTSEDRTQDRYTIRGYVSTAIKHGLNAITVLRDALPADPGCPTYPHPPDHVPAPPATATGGPTADRYLTCANSTGLNAYVFASSNEKYVS